MYAVSLSASVAWLCLLPKRVVSVGAYAPNLASWYTKWFLVCSWDKRHFTLLLHVPSSDMCSEVTAFAVQRFSTGRNLRNCVVLLSNWFTSVVLLVLFLVNTELLTSACLKMKRLFASVSEIFIIHVGACCPLCAGMLRILYDKDKLDMFARVTSLIMPSVQW